MPKIVIEIPESVDEEKIKFWIARGVSKELFKRIALDALKSGIDIDLKDVLKEFEETRKEIWEAAKEKYIKKGLIE